MAYNNNFRTLPARIFEAKGYVPSSTATLDSSGSIWVTSLIISNIDTSTDVTLTLTNAEATPLTLYKNIFPPGDHREFVYEEGWEFTGGMKWVASNASMLYVQVLGRQKG